MLIITFHTSIKTYNKVSDDFSKKYFEKINENIDSMRKKLVI